MTRMPRQTVALLDPLWFGHHPMYFAEFTASFLRAGADVLSLCPEPGTARRDLAACIGNHAGGGLDRVSFHHLPPEGTGFPANMLPGNPLRTLARWKDAAEALADAEKSSGRHADLLFFPYLDVYLRYLPFPSIPRFFINRPWSGLYLRNHHYGAPPGWKRKLVIHGKGDPMLRSPLCDSIGVLDERFIPAMEDFTGKKISAFPDITRSDLPPQPAPLALEILRKAAGRKIIGMIGLERRKGFLQLLEVAGLARAGNFPYYIVCAGGMNLKEYTEPERRMLADLAHSINSGNIDNLHFDPSAGRIPDEADFNSVFSTFDIAWAAYENFHGSSGTIGKAAAFEIPCLATAGECIGRRIEHYRTGLTIPEVDPALALEAIHRLCNLSDWNGDPLQPDYHAFRKQHSRERLDELTRGISGHPESA